MLNLLAFDTSTELCSAALLLDGQQLLTREAMVGNRHSDILLPMVTDLLREADLTLDRLDGIAYGKGPGSFTGLRIACGIAQGLALGADLPVLGIVTLEAMAWRDGSERVIACLDARMHEVYYGAYRRVGAGLVTEIEPCVRAPDAVPMPAGNGWRGLGPGFGAWPEVLGTRLRDHLSGIVADQWPHAQAVAELALPRFAAGQGLPPDLAEPYYVRDKVAKKTRERLEAQR